MTGWPARGRRGPPVRPGGGRRRLVADRGSAASSRGEGARPRGSDDAGTASVRRGPSGGESRGPAGPGGVQARRGRPSRGAQRGRQQAVARRPKSTNRRRVSTWRAAGTRSARRAASRTVIGSRVPAPGFPDMSIRMVEKRGAVQPRRVIEPIGKRDRSPTIPVTFGTGSDPGERGGGQGWAVHWAPQAVQVWTTVRLSVPAWRVTSASAGCAHGSDRGGAASGVFDTRRGNLASSCRHAVIGSPPACVAAKGHICRSPPAEHRAWTRPGPARPELARPELARQGLEGRSSRCQRPTAAVRNETQHRGRTVPLAILLLFPAGAVQALASDHRPTIAMSTTNRTSLPAAQ